jgi:hypothetical protein
MAIGAVFGAPFRDADKRRPEAVFEDFVGESHWKRLSLV